MGCIGDFAACQRDRGYHEELARNCDTKGPYRHFGSETCILSRETPFFAPMTDIGVEPESVHDAHSPTNLAGYNNTCVCSTLPPLLNLKLVH